MGKSENKGGGRRNRKRGRRKDQVWDKSSLFEGGEYFFFSSNSERKGFTSFHQIFFFE